jgi:hypothetical protein
LLIYLRTLQIEFLYLNNNEPSSIDPLALCTLRNLRVLYIYHGYAVEPLNHAFINLLACLPNLTSLTFYLDSETALLRQPLLAVARVGR